ncbi:MAG: helix-turn-helix transcriptional regulator [Oscillospiraceae bacterium]|nr:helix-turn-helix transcriptional regulator [Oscillospiraceae bacterium]
MEFGEKLQQLRKSRNLTQEELARELYVSRTAVSKWESGRGYPSIDSLKELSRFFAVTVDELLSGDALISIAQRENRAGIRRMCGLLSGITDLLSLTLILLPLYPKTVGTSVYAVNLAAYMQTAARNRAVYWVLFLALVAAGGVKLLLTCLEKENWQRAVTHVSLVLGSVTVTVLALAGETYAVAVAFFLLLIKGFLLLQSVKHG